MSVALKDLYKIAGGLNIEGGRPALKLKEKDKTKIWVNLVNVLDCPLSHKMTFNDLLDIVAKNQYSLLENGIEDLNEHKVLSGYLMVIFYYMYNGHTLMNWSKDKQLKITIHVHQDVTCQPLVNLLKDYITDFIMQHSMEMGKIVLD